MLGYFGAVAFYKYLAVMSSQKKKKNLLKGKFSDVPVLQVL